MDLVFTRNIIAEASLSGMGLETIGGLYLAYDLLGGKRGPLRIITRAVGYTALFLIGYLIVLGLKYAVVAAAGMGITIAIEFAVSEHFESVRNGRKLQVLPFGVMRGLVLGIASTTVFGIKFGVVFGLLSGVGLSIVYLCGFGAIGDAESNRRPRLTAHKSVASLLRGIAVSVAGVLSSFLVLGGLHAWAVGLRLGLAAGTVSAIVTLFSPILEWRLENLPERRLGVIGLVVILIGTVLQSLQYWIVLIGS